MPFPIKTASVSAQDGPELLTLLEEAAKSTGDKQLDDMKPHEWAQQLLIDGALERGEAIGLAAALIQRGTAAAACVGARLATQLAEPELGKLLLRALEGLDVGLLLTIDPIDGACSTEDTLLRSAHASMDHSLVESRHELLAHLRRAGLADLEFQILANHGSPTEIRLWLPAILEEIDGLSSLQPLADLAQRGDDPAQAMAAAIRQLPEEVQLKCQEHVTIPELIETEEQADTPTLE